MQIEYRAGYKYQLAKTVSVQTSIYPDQDIETDYILLTKPGLLTIIKGYAWDGPSGPTIDRPTFMSGSLAHDAVYQLMRMELLPRSCKEQADLLLRDICIDDGMWEWWADNVVYNGVRVGGNSSTDPANRKPVITAP